VIDKTGEDGYVRTLILRALHVPHPVRLFLWVMRRLLAALSAGDNVGLSGGVDDVDDVVLGVWAGVDDMIG